VPDTKPPTFTVIFSAKSTGLSLLIFAVAKAFGAHPGSLASPLLRTSLNATLLAACAVAIGDAMQASAVSAPTILPTWADCGGCVS
jgi:hypothetical protein